MSSRLKGAKPLTAGLGRHLAVTQQRQGEGDSSSSLLAPTAVQGQTGGVSSGHPTPALTSLKPKRTSAAKTVVLEISTPSPRQLQATSALFQLLPTQDDEHMRMQPPGLKPECRTRNIRQPLHFPAGLYSPCSSHSSSPLCFRLLH